MAEEMERHLRRRRFLQGATLGGLAAVAAPQAAKAQPAPGPAPDSPRNPGPAPRNTEVTDRDEGVTYSSCGGDYMVDVLRSLGIEYFAATPGNTFMGLHEAVLNYGMTTAPRLRSLTTMHEEASVAMCHGYAKIEGKPMACAFHGAVGTQHASMAIYNAYVDRVPVFMMTGVGLEADKRSSGIEWQHSPFDGPAMVRDFTKWDDTPANLRTFGESAVRAWKFAMTPPHAPTLLAVDTQMQEEEIPGGETRRPPIPKLPSIRPPSGDANTVREVAKILVAAEHPLIYADCCARTAAGLKSTIELAEVLGAPVVDSGNRMNFPWRHPLNQTGRYSALRSQADVLLALEPGDPFDVVTAKDRLGDLRPALRAGAKAVTVSAVELMPKGNYQDMERYAGYVDIAVEADAEATLPFLVEEVKRLMPAARSAYDARAEMFAKAHLEDLNRSRQAAVFGWDDSPISMPRLAMEMYEAMRGEDWSLVSHHYWQSSWAQRLWDAKNHYQYIGGSGGNGVGYMTPAGLGAALANQKYGRLSVSVVGDGDLMFGPGSLWTAAHERIPILYVVHNNRGYHQEIMQMQKIANRRQRGVDRVGIACGIDNPKIDYAMVAKGLGVFSQGPIENPKDLGPALRRAVAVVKRGEPALVDVVSQGR